MRWDQDEFPVQFQVSAGEFRAATQEDQPYLDWLAERLDSYLEEGVPCRDTQEAD